MQLNIFEFTRPKYKITKPIRLIELFAGIGSQAKALKNIGADFTHYKVVEFDKYALASYNAVHNTNFETQDITLTSAEDLEIVETDKYDYIMTYSFPCQDLSLAGDGKGMKKGDNTRSGLLWEVERLLDGMQELPQVLLMENVPQVIGSKNLPDFLKWERKLESLGYSNYFQNLNAKHYGMPQNRNRTYMISILGDYHYSFPKRKKLKLKKQDLYDTEIREAYILSEAMVDYMLGTNQRESKYPRQKRFFANILRKNQDVALAVTGNPGQRATDNFVLTKIEKQMITEDGDIKRYINSDIVDKFEENDIADISFPKGYNKGNRVYKDYAPTITPTTVSSLIVKQLLDGELALRKLTPKECWRLMGFTDDDFDKASKVNSNAQLYKQAGNSIVVQVLEEIFKQLL